MTNVKLAVIYYSVGGVNHQLSKWAEEGAKEAGAEVRVLKVPGSKETGTNVPVVTLDDLEWADSIIFSVPTRFGGMAAQMKDFLDTTGGLWFQGKLANKVVSAMSSAQNPHGGQEATILSLYTSMYHWGAIVAAPGYTDASIFAAGGNPYGTSATVDQEGNIVGDIKPAVIHQAKRTVEIAKLITQGK